MATPSRTNPAKLIGWLDPADPRPAKLAAETLRSGGLVVIPTETVYGLAVCATDTTAVDRLHASRAALGVKAAGGGQPSSWHAPSIAAVRSVFPLRSPLHRRVASVLLPGPVTLLIECSADELAQARASLGVGEGVIDDGRVAVVRVADSPWTRALVEAAECPIAAEGVWISTAAAARDAAEAATSLDRAGVAYDLALDAGPAPLGRPSTVVRLTADGGYTVARAGVYDAAYIQRRVRRLIMFVCTGNTCRSPMAEALATAAVATGPGEVPTVVQSAGLAGGGGSPTTPETVRAVEELGIAHRFSGSRAVTASVLSEADVVFAMTRSHVAGLARMAPGEKSKVHLLDPSGRDVPDPIGSGQRTYTDLAQAMKVMIAQRLKELDA